MEEKYVGSVIVIVGGECDCDHNVSLCSSVRG